MDLYTISWDSSPNEDDENKRHGCIINFSNYGITRHYDITINDVIGKLINVTVSLILVVFILRFIGKFRFPQRDSSPTSS